MKVVKKMVDIEFEEEELEPLVKAFIILETLEDEVNKVIKETKQKDENEESLNEIYSKLYLTEQILKELLYFIDPYFDETEADQVPPATLTR